MPPRSGVSLTFSASLSSDKRLTVGVGHSEFSLLEVFHFVYDFVGDGLEFSHLGFEAAEAFLVGDGVVVDCICADVDVEVDGNHGGGGGFGSLGVFEADAQIRMRVRVDRQPRLALDVLLGEVDVVVLAAVDHFDVQTLIRKVEWLLGDGVGRDDHERVRECIVPDALGVRVCRCGQVELDRLNECRREHCDEQQQEPRCAQR